MSKYKKFFNWLIGRQTFENPFVEKDIDRQQKLLTLNNKFLESEYSIYQESKQKHVYNQQVLVSGEFDNNFFANIAVSGFYNLNKTNSTGPK